MRRTLATAIALALALGACKREAAPPAATAAATAPAQASAAQAQHDFSADITAEDFNAHVRTLSSDEFGGRGPGTDGEEKTVEYIKAQFARIGLQPGNGSDWFQSVPMVSTTADPATVMQLAVADKVHELKFGEQMVVGTRSGQSKVSVAGSELVFVGYGVNAPELGWNDYAGVDVKGKTVVMFVNDPGFHAKDASLFEGERMTYYGRWTYKFEEAARQGAAAAIIIHDDAGAAYGWDVVRNSWSGEQHDLKPADDPEPRLPVQGWITNDVARQLFTDAGMDLDAALKAAGRRGFKAQSMDARLSVDLASTIRESVSRNVIGLLPGTEAPDEAVVYMAHWDHLGTHEGEAGDAIYNGAIDNATGVAGIIELAEYLKKSAPTKRSAVFIAVTLEESGLLGSKYYVAHPVVPLANTVGVINLDAMPVTGKSRDMTITGMGNSELEDLLKSALQAQDRVAKGESDVSAGFYFRSDHFNFAKAGVPALYAKGGNDLLSGGKAAGDSASEDYRKNKYHKPADEFDPAWDASGVVQDLQALAQVGGVLGNDGGWPNWYEGNAFRSARDKLRPPAAQPAPDAAGTP